MFANLLSGMDMDSALQMLKKTFDNEGIGSIVVFIDKEGRVKTEKLLFNVYDSLNDLLINCPEALAYLKSKQSK